jgi:hypothetical protein
MLRGPLARKGYCRWWHSFSGVSTATGETRTFFVEFYVVNPALGGEQPILGQHPYYKKRGIRPSYVCVKAGVFPDAHGNGGKQLHAFYPVSSLKAAKHPLVFQAEDCFCSEERIRGFVEVSPEEASHRFFMSDAGTMEWDLEVHKAVACHTGFLASPLFQAWNALDSYWHGEGIKSFFRGAVILDGIPYEVSEDTSFGYADKHWGRSFNRPWIQLSCGQLSSDHTGKQLRHSVLAVNGCCPRFLFIPLRRKLMIQLTYTGEDYDFGMKPFVLSRCRWETKETNKRFIWHIIAKNRKAIIKISGSCTKEQMLHMQYEDPDGQKSSLPLWAGAAGVGSVQLYRRIPGGRELIDTLHMGQALCEYRKDT